MKAALDDPALVVELMAAEALTAGHNGEVTPLPAADTELIVHAAQATGAELRRRLPALEGGGRAAVVRAILALDEAFGA